MQDHSTPDPTRRNVCPACPNAPAVLDRVAHWVTLGHALTAQYPVLAGIMRLDPCPLGYACQLDWRSEGGRVSLCRAGQPIRVQRAARGFFA